MFTGIVEAVGVVKSLSGSGKGKTARISFPEIGDSLLTGESISVNGVCLTVVETKGLEFNVEISGESLMRSNLGEIKRGDMVNLERSMRLTDRLGGHLVYGHIDGLAKLVRRVRRGNSEVFELKADDNIMKYIVFKGSVALNGVSLTVSGIDKGSFEVTLVPFTMEQTNLGRSRPKDRLNVEVDIVGKYVEKFLSLKGDSGMIDKLRSYGYIKEE